MANVKITELDALAAVAAADVLPVVDDVAGTPITKRATVQALLNTLGTTKGDLFVFDGTNLVRVGVGDDDQVLTADAAEAAGVKWAAGGGGGGSPAFTVRVAASDADAASIAAADYTCDGTADQVQINSAITDANAAGGGRVLLSEGTFAIAASVAALADVEVVGMGADATILRVPDAHGTGFAMLSGAVTGFSMGHLTADGNDAGHAVSVDFCATAMTRCRLYRMRFTGMSDKILETSGGSFEVRECRSDTIASTHYRLTGGSHRFIDNVLTASSGAGIDLTSGTSENLIVGNHAISCSIGVDGPRSILRDNRVDSAQFTLGGTNSIAAGNVVEGGQFNVNGNQCVASGNVVLRGGGQNGINVNGGNDVVIIGNQVYDAQYSIRFDSGLRGLVTGNVVRTTVGVVGVWLRGSNDDTAVVGNDLRSTFSTGPIDDDTATGILNWPADATNGDNFA